MTTTLESLRKDYDKLNTYERAVMASKALADMNGELVDALDPPDVWTAYHTDGNKMAFLMLAAFAVSDSKNGEMVLLAATIMASKLADQLVKAGEGAQLEKVERELEEWETRAAKGFRRSAAWLLALEALDRETGGACMCWARFIAKEHVEYVLGRKGLDKVDYSKELNAMRELWNVTMKSHLDAPLAKEPDAEAWQ